MWAGDLNVAPNPKDVFDGVTNPRRAGWPGHIPWERKNFARAAQEARIVDIFEQLKPEAQGRDRYSFYQTKQHKRHGNGWRLDHLMADRTVCQGSGGL